MKYDLFGHEVALLELEGVGRSLNLLLLLNKKALLGCRVRISVTVVSCVWSDGRVQDINVQSQPCEVGLFCSAVCLERWGAGRQLFATRLLCFHHSSRWACAVKNWHWGRRFAL